MGIRIEHRFVDGVEQKWCNKCRQWLPLESFCKASVRRDGLYYCCRDCQSVVTGHKPTGRRFRPYRHQVVDGLEQKRCSSCKQWLTLDYFYKARTGGDTSGLASRCRRCQAEYVQVWCRDHPEQAAAIRHRRRAREAEAEGSYTEAEFVALCAYYGNQCPNVDADYHEGALEADHIVPLSRGGSNDISNIQPLCHHCNSTKGAKTVDYRANLGWKKGDTCCVG